MLTLETKIARELHAIEKLEVKTVNRLNKIKAMLSDIKAPVSIGNVAHHMQSVQVKKTWGPGRKIPEGIKLEIIAMLENKIKPIEISKRYQVSLPSIQKIKEKAGLVKKRTFI